MSLVVVLVALPQLQLVVVLAVVSAVTSTMLTCFRAQDSETTRDRPEHTDTPSLVAEDSTEVMRCMWVVHCIRGSK